MWWHRCPSCFPYQARLGQLLSIQVNTARCGSRSINRRCARSFEPSGGPSGSSKSGNCVAQKESAVRQGSGNGRSRALRRPNQQQPTKTAWQKARPPHRLGVKRRAQLLHMRIEPRSIQDPIDPLVKRMPAALGQSACGYPDPRLMRAALSFAHRHALNCTTTLQR